MPDNIENGWGAQALDLNQQQRRYQNAIVSGCGASDGTNAMEIDVASGEAIVAGSRVSVSTTTLTLTSSNTDPRKDVIYIDSAGVPQVATGTAAPAAPSGETGRDTYQPQPPDLSATDAAVVAEVWVAGGTGDTGSGDISDRRVFADIVAGSVDAQSASIGSTRISPDPNADPQTVIDNAPVGATIEFDKSVTHTLSSALTVTTDGLTIRGPALKLADGANDAVLYIHSCSGVRVGGCDINGNRANQTGPDRETANGVIVSNASNIMVGNSRIYDTYGQNILFTSYTTGNGSLTTQGDISDVEAIGNRLENAGNGSLLFEGGGSNVSKNGRAINNTCLNADNEHIQAIDGFDGVSAVGNYVEGTTPGFIVESHTGRNATAQRGFQISGNFCYIKPGTENTACVRMDRNNLNQNGIVVSGNTLIAEGTNARAVVCDNSTADFLTVVGNFCGSNGTADGQRAIFVTDSDIDCVTAVGNTIHQWQRGIQMSGDGTTSVTATGNNILNCDVGMRALIGGVIYSGNVIQDCTVGYEIREFNGNTVGGFGFLGNYTRNCGTAISVNTGGTGGTIDKYIIKNNIDDGSTTHISESNGSATNTVVADNLS